MTYNNLDPNGAFVAGGYQDQWFRYDTLNRVVTNKGALTNGTIVRGAIGSDVTYDAAGRRATVTTNVAGTTRRESYSYLPEGQLSGVAFGTLAADGTYQAGGTSSLAYDGAGRLTRQIDSDASGVAYDRSVTYNEKGQALSETVTQRQGGDTIVANTTPDYGTGATHALGAPVAVTISSTRNGQATTTSQTSFTYEYFDGPLQSTITYNPDVNGNVQNSTGISSSTTTRISETVNTARRITPPFRCRQSLLQSGSSLSISTKKPMQPRVKPGEQQWAKTGHSVC